MHGSAGFHSGVTVAKSNEGALIFDEAAQKLFAVDGPASLVAETLAQGAAPHDVARILAREHALSAREARTFLVRCILEWRRMGFFRRNAWQAPAPQPRRPRPQPRRADGSVAARQLIGVAGTRIQLLYETGPIAEIVAPAFAHLERADGEGEFLVEVFRADGDLAVSINGAPCEDGIEPCQIVPFLKTCFSEIVMIRGDYSLALHAAGLSREGRALILAAPSGSGKTTLSLALVRRGFALMTDDTVFFDHDSGRYRGLPFRAGVKSVVPGTIESAAGQECLHVRDDGIQLHYVDPGWWCLESQPLALIAFPRYQEGAQTQVRPVGDVQALKRLLSEGHAPGSHLRAETFRALVHEVRAHRCLELVYSSLDEACAVLAEGWP